MTTMHRLRVTLEDVEPPVWRRLLVPSAYRLDQVAEVLIVGMGWQGYHLWDFRIGEHTYSDPRFEDQPETDLPATALLGDVAAAGEAFSFDYDFGDGWGHHVLVEEIRQTGDTKPQCVAGERACPPDDVGGPWGYQELLEALGDPGHERHQELTDWLPDGFDPEAFDLVAVDAALVQPAPRRGRNR